MSEIPRLRVRKNEDRRLKAGHPWVFSNEVDTSLTPLTSFAPGDTAIVENSRGESLGLAYINPNTLISARILSRDTKTHLDTTFFQERIKRAQLHRESFYEKPFYRLVFSESDGLPGLIIDRYDHTFVVQTNTAGMEKLQDPILAALESMFKPQAIIFRNNSSLRLLEGLETETRIGLGNPTGRFPIEENNTRFLIDPMAGQKTGWFFDHRDNRAMLAKLCRGQRVLDLFAYTGAWGIPAASGGAKAVICVDISETALDMARENSILNGVENVMQFMKSDAFDYLREAREQKQKYDIIIVDPPAFIKRKKDAAQGVEAYRRLNQAALQILSEGGILVSASCSFHLQPEKLHDILRASARHIDRHLTIFAKRGQAVDHPVHPAIPETEYLKAFFCRSNKSL